MVTTPQTGDDQLQEERITEEGLSPTELLLAPRLKEECELKTIFINQRICLKTLIKKPQQICNNQQT
jgi:hypothetical protein